MNDRYLFRAKRIDNGEWVEGCLLVLDDETYRIATSCLQGDVKELLNVCAYEVDQSTICQCTWLKDKNGKLIWENDIVKCVDVNAETEFFAVVEFGNPNGFYSWGYQLKHIWGDEPNLDILLWIDMEETGAFCEVIGNIFDEGSENIGKGTEEN